ncbi:SH3 and cysteine-rich domain-containing protein isoform X3 [Silurus meridionalis]|uniref:SH3 and cysteine-rich domain-containing protein isoform X3 n=1 Tax=Silurus meridionalis TaxID=175797 RepID=UPI001EE9FAC4|nr:SH3 and cysteine-rich domain-containing protein isoform X3 [Silurus meridionalis]
MIPPANMTQDDSDGNEKEKEIEKEKEMEKEKERAPEHSEPPQSPTSTNQHESKLQKLKRSLSFRTKSLRSKSADNFFQRPSPEVSNSSSTGQLSTIGVSVSAPPESCYLPPLTPPPTMPSGLPLTICSPSRAPRPPDPTAHTFLEHTFKKPHFCDVCNHMIPKGFRRYSSSPLLIQEQFGCIKEVMPIACGSKVDPVYEALRFGTSLAQKTKRPSGSDSPPRNSSSDLAQVPEEAAHCSHAQLIRKHSDDVFTSLENGTETFHIEEKKPEDPQTDEDEDLQKDLLPLNTYVALYRFIPQESQDLEMRPGDRIILADNSNEDWWKGMIEDRIGFFPASYAHLVREGDRVFRCNRTFIGCKEQGQITIKEGQICVSAEDERNGFIQVASGKKQGFVPCDVLEDI